MSPMRNTSLRLVEPCGEKQIEIKTNQVIKDLLRGKSVELADVPHVAFLRFTMERLCIVPYVRRGRKT
jgi:hypothetical protein